MGRAVTSLAIAALFAAGCGGSPAAPGPPADDPVPASLRIVADPVIDLTPGEVRALQIEERDAAGALIARPPTAYAWTTSAPGTASIGADGIVRAQGDLGGAAISVRAPSGLTATVHAWVQLPAQVPSTYKITLLYDPEIPPGWRDAFRLAADMLEHAIRAPLAPYRLDSRSHTRCLSYPGERPLPALSGVETGTIIYVGRRSGFGQSTGFPCIQRPLPRATAVLGQVTIPRGDTYPGRPPVRLALHEMGHGLGLVGVAPFSRSPGVDPTTLRHTGPFTLEGYRRTFGHSVPFVQIQHGHWPFGGDVMSDSAPAAAMSYATIGALMDMGYPAAWYGKR